MKGFEMCELLSPHVVSLVADDAPGSDAPEHFNTPECPFMADATKDRDVVDAPKDPDATALDDLEMTDGPGDPASEYEYDEIENDDESDYDFEHEVFHEIEEDDDKLMDAIIRLNLSSGHPVWDEDSVV